MTSGRYTVGFALSARRSLHALPAKVYGAVMEFLRGPLAENPRQVGKPLRFELAGSYSARRGDYRIVYQIDDATHMVVVERIEHRGEAYRSR